MAYDRTNPASPAPISMKPAITTSDISLSDLLLMVHLSDTQNHKNRKVTFQQMLDIVDARLHTLDYLHITDEPTTSYSLRVEGSTYLKGGAIVSGSILDVMSANIYLRGETAAGKLTVSNTSATYALEVTGAARFNGAVVVASALGADSFNVNAHQAGTTGGYMTSAGSSGFSVKDTDGNVLLSVSTVNGSPKTEVGKFRALSTSTFVGATTFYGSVVCTDNVVVGSQTAKRLFQVNGSDFYVSDSDGAAHANAMVCTRLVVNNAADVSGNLSAASISTGFTRVTSDVNLHTSYPSAGQKQRRVIYNDSSDNIEVTLDSTGNYVHLGAQTCGDFICVSASDSDGTTWRPINGESAIN